MIEPCWDCSKPGVHRGYVRKMSSSFWVMYCDEHQQEINYTAIVHDLVPKYLQDLEVRHLDCKQT